MDKETTIFYADNIKTFGYKGMRGLIRALKRENKILKKLGTKVDWVIRLPIK